jgi:adenylate kinase
MRLVLVGPPGAGKGTQATFIAENFAIPHISTGDIFRANLRGGTPLGLEAKAYMDRGDLVPDSLTNLMVSDRLKADDVASGFLLDGYPRNVAQAEVLDGILGEVGRPLDAVLELIADDQEVIKRLSGRRTCESCGGISHIANEPPRQAGICDNCGGALTQRTDDHEEVIAKRLAVYAEQTAPIVDYYRNAGILISISATGAINDVTHRAIAALGALA